MLLPVPFSTQSDNFDKQFKEKKLLIKDNNAGVPGCGPRGEGCSGDIQVGKLGLGTAMVPKSAQEISTQQGVTETREASRQSTAKPQEAQTKDLEERVRSLEKPSPRTIRKVPQPRLFQKSVSKFPGPGLLRVRSTAPPPPQPPHMHLKVTFALSWNPPLPVRACHLQSHRPSSSCLGLSFSTSERFYFTILKKEQPQ